MHSQLHLGQHITPAGRAEYQVGSYQGGTTVWLNATCGVWPACFEALRTVRHRPCSHPPTRRGPSNGPIRSRHSPMKHPGSGKNRSALPISGLLFLQGATALGKSVGSGPTAGLTEGVLA